MSTNILNPFEIFAQDGIPMNHRWNNDSISIFNDGSDDWATTVFDQIGANDLAQATQAYRLKVGSGFLENDKALGTRTNYPTGGISCSSTLGFALFQVVNASNITGVGYTSFGSPSIAGTYAYNSAGPRELGYFQSSVEFPYIGAETITSQKVVLCWTHLGMYVKSDFQAFPSAKGFTMNNLYGRPLSSPGVYLAMFGKYYDIEMVVDTILTTDEVNQHMNFLRSKYGAL